MRLKLAVLGLVLAIGPANADKITTAYSKLDFEKDCVRIDEFEEGTPEADLGGIFRCRGFQDYPIILKVGDLRESFQFGHLRQQLIDEAWESFGAWNRGNDVVEWRLKNGNPFAAIHRFYIEKPDPETSSVKPGNEGQVLTISLVATKTNNGTGCWVGLVDARANKEANVMARKIADQIKSDHDCRTEPQFHGAVSDTVSSVTRSFPE